MGARIRDFGGSMAFNLTEIKAVSYPETPADEAYAKLTALLAGQAVHAPQNVLDVLEKYAKGEAGRNPYVNFRGTRSYAHPVLLARTQGGVEQQIDVTRQRVLSPYVDYEVVTRRNPERFPVIYRDENGERKVGATGYYIFIRDIKKADAEGNLLAFFMR